MTDLPYHEFFAMYTDLNEMLDWILFAMDMDTEMPDWSLGENSGCGSSMLDWTGLLVFLFVGVLDSAVLWSAWICFLFGVRLLTTRCPSRLENRNNSSDIYRPAFFERKTMLF